MPRDPKPTMNGRLRIDKGLIGVDGIEERNGGKALLGWLGLALVIRIGHYDIFFFSRLPLTIHIKCILISAMGVDLKLLVNIIRISYLNF